MSSAIMRFKKLHTGEEIGHALGHNKRLRNVKNADKDRKGLNTSVMYVENVQKHIKELDKLHKKTTGKKARKDAVRVIEVLMTSDKEFFERVPDSEYFETCRNWLVDIFGEENILSMDIHRDERTPHAHFLVTPVRDNQYACKKIINGRNAVRGLQNSFYDSVKHFGLERGELVEYTKAKHQSSLQFAEDVQKGKESVYQMSERERDNYATYGAMAKEEIKELKEENKELQKENLFLREERNRYKEAYDTLALGVMSCVKGNKAQKQKQVKDIYHLGYAKKMEMEHKKEKFKNDDLEL
ncbi:plasmid recombination protein [Clostridium perfringens]|uniref:MobV family relaxase n=1 Tax=Clostridium sp. TaxID=1506 RepID=UPI001DC608F9|nr:MobV family relaxase [Clostridium sp.]EJT6475629.1 plasmid recombination protein [Clostridium perfringens]EJT6481237.1 plasmid recombination protein [Clostridium perfringens]EJT6532688.1 plasmid recombination protein [Clostridium perfringens]MBS5940096.1 plasmid recombination protein [Clostridium sp.]